MTDTEEERALHATRAASFGGEAAAYAEHRPDYPAEALRWGLAAVTGSAERVLDLAAGTGKLTRNLISLGLRVTAVEPDPDMLGELRRELPEVAAMAGKAENIPLDDGAVDAVFIGQAMHWFDLGPALTEIARVLRPGGVVLALWNLDDESYPWIAELNALSRTGASRKWLVDSELPEHEDFAPFELARFPHTQRRTAQGLVATLATHSHLLVADEAERADTLHRMREFLASCPETAAGEFDRPMITTAFRAVRD